MCGIAGFVGEGTREHLKKMTRAISYRGPDGEGFLFDAKAGVGLGHRRLSIIDLQGGGQPIYNEDRSVAVIFNGEIYNFEALRATLLPRHTFATKSDTEVIAHLYEEKGEKLFENLSGMFAIALYDSKKERLLLARDRLGKKPLYWGMFGGTLLFGSEQKALMQHPLFTRELDIESLASYMSLDYVPTPRGIFKGVYKLPPASYLVFENRKIKQEIFWKPHFEESKISFAEALTGLDTRLAHSVKERLVADVPLGIFLSGGIDSTTIAYYAQKNSARPIETFSVAFKEKSFDESAYAKLAAKHLGTSHHEATFTAKDLLDSVPTVFGLLDEPLADPSILPTSLLSSFTRKKVTVALGGDGGDELFAGYPTFQAERFATLFAHLPRAVKSAAAFFADKLPVQQHKGLGMQFKAEKFIEGFGVEPKYRHARWLGSFGTGDYVKMFTPDILRSLSFYNPYEPVDRYLEEARIASPENALLYVYLRTYLMDQVLVKVDRASMWNALEVRAPFLDEHLVDFVQSLPYDFKCNGWRTKYILKELMRDKLPRAIVERQKKGFGVPVGAWLKADLRDLTHDALSESRIRKDGIFEPKYVQTLLREHERGTRNHRKLLWSLLVFQLWQLKWGR